MTTDTPRADTPAADPAPDEPQLLIGSAPVRPGEWTPLIGAHVQVRHQDFHTVRLAYRFEPQRVVDAATADELPAGSVVVSLARRVALLRVSGGWVLPAPAELLRAELAQLPDVEVQVDSSAAVAELEETWRAAADAAAPLQVLERGDGIACWITDPLATDDTYLVIWGAGSAAEVGQ